MSNNSYDADSFQAIAKTVQIVRQTQKIANVAEQIASLSIVNSAAPTLSVAVGGFASFVGGVAAPVALAGLAGYAAGYALASFLDSCSEPNPSTLVVNAAEFAKFFDSRDVVSANGLKSAPRRIRRSNKKTAASPKRSDDFNYALFNSEYVWTPRDFNDCDYIGVQADADYALAFVACNSAPDDYLTLVVYNRAF